MFSRFEPKLSIIDVANALGTPLTPWEGGLVQTLEPRATATPNTYSGNFGLDRFPFHTDLAHWRVPPRYLVLRCQVGYRDVPTLLLDGRELADAVSRNVLARAIFKPRRPRNGAFELLRLYEACTNGDELLRWDEIFLTPASRIGETADLAIREWLAKAEPLQIALHLPGDTLVVDNWRMLHARSPIPPGREDRSIQRVYLGALN
nr:TauD/TfdA family dioxygenase [Agrobacterium tumefaciens]